MRSRHFTSGLVLLLVSVLSVSMLPGRAGAVSRQQATPLVHAYRPAPPAVPGHLTVTRSQRAAGQVPDETIEIDPGLDYFPDIASTVVQDAQAANPRLSDTIKETIDSHPLALAPDTGNWTDFDGTLAATPNGISLTIPGSEVQDNASWWQNVGISGVAYAAGLVLRVACIGSLKVYLPALPLVTLKTVCAAASAFSVTMIRGLWLQYIEGQLGDPGAWASTFGTALEAAVAASLWEAGLNKWAEDRLPLHIRTLTAWIRGFDFTGWLAWLRNTRDVVGGYLDNIAGALPDVIRRLPGGRSTALRVMVVGDSMSQGREGDFTWRYRLWQWFESQNVNVEFVGPYTGTRSPDRPGPPAVPPLQGDPPAPPQPPNTSGGYASGVAFDSAHFAVWGRQVAQDKDQIRAQVAAYRPNLLLVGLGFNDLGWFVSGPEGTLVNMKTLVDQARAANPDISIALANVPQRTYIGRADLPRNTDTYNAMLAASIPSWSTLISPVALVDWRGNYACALSACPAGYDGLHPNALGEYEIAHAFETTLHEDFGIGFDVPQVPLPDEIPPRPTPVPTNLAAVSSPDGVTVTWDPVYGAIGYTVRYRLVGTSDWAEYPVSTNRYDTTWTVDGQQWEYQVRTANGDQLTSGWSGTVSATAHPQTASGPVGIVTQATATGVDVSWAPPTGPYTDTIDRYQVLTFDRDTPGAFVNSTAVKGLSAHVDGLIPAHHYIVAVATWNAAGGGFPGVARPVTIGAATPPAPTNLQVTSTDPTTVRLTWTGSNQAAGYRVWVRNATAGGTLSASENIVDTTTTGVAYLYPGTWNFEFCVTAVNGAAESDKSNCVIPLRPTAMAMAGVHGTSASTDSQRLLQVLRTYPAACECAPDAGPRVGRYVGR